MTLVSGDRPMNRDARRAYLEHVRAQLRTERGLPQPAPITLSTKEAVGVHAGISPLRTYNDATLSRLLNSLPRTPLSILDVGCGRGHYVEVFRKHGVSGRYVGIDVAPSSEWESFAASPSELKAEYLCGSIEAAPLPDTAFDLILSSSALEHIEKDREAVRRLFAVTRPGGLGLHMVPSLQSYLLYGYHGYRRYGAVALSEMFQSAGFEIMALHRQGGGASFLLHMLWIGILESTLTRAILHDRWRDGGPEDWLRRLLCRPWLTGLRKPGLSRTVYVALARVAFQLDRVLLRPTSGYAILVRRP